LLKRSLRASVLLVAASFAVVVVGTAGCSKPATTGATIPSIDIVRLLDHDGVDAVEDVFGPPDATLTGVIDTTTGDSGGATYELPDGKTYSFSWGLNESGEAIIVSHIVGSEGPLSSGDREFASAVQDGVSSLDDMNTYLERISGGSWKSVESTTQGPKTNLHVWTLDDGGFFIEDHSVLSENEARRLDLQLGSPYGVLR